MRGGSIMQFSRRRGDSPWDRFFAGLALVVIAGCGPAGPAVQPVSGTLTIGGAPAKNVQIVFHPVDAGGLLASGQVDPSGVYTLRSGNTGAKGALVGKYKVVLSSFEDESMEAATARYTSGAGKPSAPAKPAFPKEYLAAATSPKEVEVKPGPNTIDIAVE